MKIRIAGISAAVAAGVVALVWLSNQSIGQPAAAPGANVDGAKIANADADPGEWLTNGRTYSEQRYSPLKQIDKANVKNLGVAWEFRTNTVRGLETTPLVSDGVMFVTGSWSKLWALDAKPASRSGPMTRRCPANGAAMPVATSSIAASRCGRARSISARSTDGL
jgi:quinohemoprotein ethanol dehydrogenase